MIYEEYKKTCLWEIVKKTVKGLVRNQDLKITTDEDYITGAIVKGLQQDTSVIEKIAEKLWKVHSHSLYPYYVDKKENEQSWKELDENVVEQSDVSKNFFRQIANEMFATKR